MLSDSHYPAIHLALLVNLCIHNFVLNLHFVYFIK